MSETFKKEEKKEETRAEEAKRRFIHLLDEEQVEIKRLDANDIDDSVKVMQKCAFEVTAAEVKTIVDYEKSFGATVNRMLVGVGLSWPSKLNMKDKTITVGEPNALYLEDPAVLLTYEGRGVRRMLIKEREDEAIRSGYKYIMAYLYEDVPKGDIGDYIREAGSQLEKVYLSENYEFYRTTKGILAVKKL